MYFDELSRELAKLGTNGVNDKDGNIYKIYLGGVYADYIARTKLFK